MISLEGHIKGKKMKDFINFLNEIQREIPYKVSSRGWAYLLEGKRLINKDDFDKVQNVINKARKEGFLPVDFVAEEEARSFDNVHTPATYSIAQGFRSYLESDLRYWKYYEPNWWENEEYYVQCIVEKVDIVTLFQGVCEDYHIPIANSKGWSSISQRGEYAKRFKQAEEKGLKCVLLYCGDHDPDGLRISDTLRKNLEDIKDIRWKDGTRGYDPENLIIRRFGLNYDFIENYNLTWIDNLITGSKKNLADPKHRNYHMDYVQDYLHNVGVRKCEANAIITIPSVARQLLTNEIKDILGTDALDRFSRVRKNVEIEFKDMLKRSGAGKGLKKVFKLLDKFDEDLENEV